MLERYYYIVNLAFVLLLYLSGEGWRYFNSETGTSGFQLVVWGGVVSTVCVYHIIWSANCVYHRYRTRRLPTRDDIRNNFIISILTGITTITTVRTP